MTIGKLVEASVSMDEGDFIWQADLGLESVTDYRALPVGTAFTLHMGGESWLLVVDSTSLSRPPNSAQPILQIKGVSPLALLHRPYATPLTVTFDAPIMARTAVETLLDLSVDWQIVDWQIPAHRLAIQDMTPVEAANLVVEAAGGVLESNKDGTVRVRYRYPVATNAYATATVDQTYTDSEDNLSVSEEAAPFETYNRYRVRTAQGVFADRLAWVPDETRGDYGIIELYPSPWRDTVRLVHTDGSVVAVTTLGIVSKEVTEQVEFRAGQGSLQYPIASLVSVEWISQALGTIAFEARSTSVSAPIDVNWGYGLANLTYRTECIQYAAQAPVGSTIQFLVEDLS